MTNPWLNVPASDYEGHMGSPDVDQLSFLASTFKDVLEQYNCSTVALLGCATGNGLEHINREHTHRVTAVDINPEYLEILHQRYGNSIPGIEIIQADLENCELEKEAYSLIFAGLIFEYLEAFPMLHKISNWLKVDGSLVAVLQLPADGDSVTKTPYKSLRSLSSIMKLVDSKQFSIAAADAGLEGIDKKFITLGTGKSFYIGIYKKP
jgi:trans-aconitate methyltransferase